MSEAKQRIIEIFKANVLGKREDTSSSNPYHDGKGGHWLERQMGLKANSSNTPDIFGYEMKNDTTSKTSLGDWSPDKAIFKKPKQITRDEFLTFFGKPNLAKRGRCSWSGEPVPKVKQFNPFGQMLIIDKDLNIHAVYSYSKDLRDNKRSIIPQAFQTDNVILATWTNHILRKKVERKFNQKGWFKCLKDSNGFYSEIVFYDPINYELFISLVERGIVFFDSGMYQGNARPYANWRANNSELDQLTTSQS